MGVGTGFVVTVHGGKPVILTFHSHYSAFVDVPAIAGDKCFSFHHNSKRIL